MEATSIKIAKVFSTGGDIHYVLPYFQREYAWEKENWDTFLKDIFSIYDEFDYDPDNLDNLPEHFMGALVVINDGTRKGTIPTFKLVDGQQRLTTISLVFCALARLIEHEEPSLFRKIRKLIVNPDENGDLHFKIFPTTKYGDRDSYKAIIEDGDFSGIVESNIPKAYDYILKELRKRAHQGFDPEKFFVVMTNCLRVVFIDLNQTERPYEIFESLNAKNKPLTQADLVRNYIAMRLSAREQEKVFNKDWATIESLLQEKRSVGRSGFGELTAFLRHYIALLTGALPNQRHVYERFRDRMEKNFSDTESFTEEIETLKRFAEYYNYLLRPQDAPDPEIRKALSRLAIMENSTAFPFLLGMYEKYNDMTLAKDDFLTGLALLENYLVRRYLTGEQSNYLNKMFPTLWREIDERNFVQSLKEALLTKNCPSDYKLRQSAAREQLYDGRSQTRAKIYLILETINVYLSRGSGGYTVLDDDPTIEHVMPQTLSKRWQVELGENFQRIFDDYLNTIGNLTIVTSEWNSSLSNSPFEIKRLRFAEHALLINHYFVEAGIEQWNESTIQNRALWLIDCILQIWPSFGEISIPSTTDKPKVLVVFGQLYEVNSWRDVAFSMADAVMKLSDDFDSIAEQMPAYFSRSERPRSREMPNGWWLNVNLSSNSVKSFCRNIAALAGINDEWSIEFE